MLEQFMEDCLPWEEPHAGAGVVWWVLPWGGRSGRDNVWWTDHNPHFASPCTAEGGEEVKKIGSEVKPGKKGGVGEGGVRFSFSFSLPYCDLIADKLK